jgi:D-serine deaminase-like pyridoxal phosphate-dependent protein
MERPVFQPVGTPVEELDTPALVVDLDVLEANIARFHSSFDSPVDRTRINVRPHVSCHQCPHIAHLQLAAANPGGGIAVNTVGEAEVFAGAGFNDILISRPIAGRPKLARLCALAQSYQISVVVDDAGHVEALSAAVSAAGATLGILVEVDAGSGGSGVAMGPDAAALAQKVSSASGLRLDGLMASLPGHSGRRDDAGTPITAPENEAKVHLLEMVETSRLLERQRASAPVVSVAASGYNDVAGVPGISEIQAGAYALMDHAHCLAQPDYQPAARILASIISHPTEGSAVLDAGHKATGPDLGLPVLADDDGAKAVRFSAEHGVLELQPSAYGRFMPGDKVWLVPFDLELSLNQYDYIRAVRKGKLEGFWPIAARGRFS